MASSSRNSSISALKNYNYDVFVSFRGEDTRYNFTDFLFDAFQTKAIFAFRDDNNLPKGESIAPKLLRAIQHSQIYVVVFSKNYASSPWCLQELEKICECYQVPGKHVLPVFYDVDPSDVRHQKGIYAEAFAKYENRFQYDSHMVLRWRKALTKVANLSGWDLRDKPQSAEIKKMVQKIINILDCISSSFSKDLVEICGTGGIGKTTLATVLYDRISQQFGTCCFIDDVSKIYRLHGPLGVQKQILDQTVGQEHHQVCNHYNAANLIRRRLCRQKALMIFDNVDHIKQLEKSVVHREWLSAGSRIIIISRDEHILKQYGVDAVYKVPLLDWANSLQLLCRKAFKLDHILSSSYGGLVNGILNHANGLPLAIKVLGSFLFGRDISEWKSALANLRGNPGKDVMDVLRLSFDGLRETEKEIFLHICFFDMHMEKYVKNVLNCCGFHVDIGLRVLIDKSLVSIEGEKIVMHGLLEELGSKIVAENTSKEPTKWFDKQRYDVRLENMEKNVEVVLQPQIMTVILKVYMHCEGCSQDIKRRIERIKGVVSAEPDQKNSLVTVKGVFEKEKLVKYVYKRTGKQAVIVKQEPEKKEEAKQAVIVKQEPEKKEEAKQAVIVKQEPEKKEEAKQAVIVKQEPEKKEEAKQAVIVKQEPEKKEEAKQAMIVKQEPEKKEEAKETKEEEKKTEEKDENEKGSGEGEEKKEAAPGDEKLGGGGGGGDGGGVGGGGDGGGDEGGGGAEETTVVEVKKNEYNSNPHSMEFNAFHGPAYPLQIFSDENPNACSVM
ncbi:unnamed protein product [Vicia faba]|uniref:Uncharacterized protein n=1 Tax=Vicia faba TaxID=3906 RepID=A0AAV1B4B6_VICFA|nr:unnamed protein product [Vicia faba]